MTPGGAIRLGDSAETLGRIAMKEDNAQAPVPPVDGTLPALAAEAGIVPPALTVIGAVVGLHIAG